MKTIWIKEFKRTRTGLIIWSAVVALVTFFGVSEYPVIGQYMDRVEDALQLIPRLGQLICGVYNVDLATPIGYFAVMYYWSGLIVFTHAIYTGASMISKESRDNTVEYIFTKPYTRDEIVLAKITAGTMNILSVGIITVAMSLLAMLPITDEPAVFGQVFLAGVGMLFTQCVLMSIGFICGAVFKSYRSGVICAAGALLASYCMMFFTQNVDRPALNFLSPLTFFAISEVVNTGINVFYTLLSIAVTGLCLFLTVKIYSAKELLA